MTVPTRKTIQGYFASGPCLMCGDPTYNAAHRLVDSIRDQFRADRLISAVARQFGLPRAVVFYLVTASIRELDWLRRYKKKDAEERMREAVRTVNEATA